MDSLGTLFILAVLGLIGEEVWRIRRVLAEIRDELRSSR